MSAWPALLKGVDKKRQPGVAIEIEQEDDTIWANKNTDQPSELKQHQLVYAALLEDKEHVQTVEAEASVREAER